MTAEVDPVHLILNRVASEHPAPILLYGYEMELWPDDAADELTRRGLLVETTRATSAECTGCELKCNKSVEVRLLPDKSARASIWCNEEPGHGSVPVELKRLRRFQATLRTVARFAADCFDVPAQPLVLQADRVAIATLQGRNGSRDVSVVRDVREIQLHVGHQVEGLAGLIAWQGTPLMINRAHLRRLVDRKMKPQSRAPKDSEDVERSTEHVTPQRAGRNAEIIRVGKKLKTRDNTWGEVAEQLSQMPFVANPDDGSRPISAETVRRILADRDKT